MTPSFRNRELLLNYHDAVIYGSDLALLESNTAWLNDACIHFRFTRLQKKSDDCKTGNDGALSIFFDPSVISFLMHQCMDEDDYQDFCHGYGNFDKTRKMFIPINDGHAASYQRPGAGNHWSLLVVHMLGNAKQEQEYWHFDSVHGNNRQAALAVAKKFSLVLGHSEPNSIKVQESAQTPQQMNGYDCGLHTLAAAEVFSSLNDMSFETHLEALKQYITRQPNFASSLRKEIANDIRELAKETT